MGWGKGRKILILWGFTEKSNFKSGNCPRPPCLKGSWTVCRFKRRLDEKKKGGVFEGCYTPMHTMGKVGNGGS